MKPILKTVWVIPVITLLLLLWPDEQSAAGKNCCASKTSSVACQSQAGVSQTDRSTAAAKQSAACVERCCGKASESYCGKESCKAGCKKCSEAYGKSCCGQQSGSNYYGR